MFNYVKGHCNRKGHGNVGRWTATVTTTLSTSKKTVVWHAAIKLDALLSIIERPLLQEAV